MTATMMHMTFYWGKSTTILFGFWRPRTWQTYLPTLLVLFLSAFLHQFLEHRSLNLKPSSSSSRPLLLKRYIAAALFGVNSALAYMLMLAVMSFNGGVFIAIMVGFSVGHFVFRCDADAVNLCC